MTAKAPPPLEFQFNEKNFYFLLYVSVSQESVQGMLELACYHHCYHNPNVLDCRIHILVHKSHSPRANRIQQSERKRLARITYRVDLDEVGIPGIARDLDVVVAELTSGSSTIDVSIVNEKQE